MCVGQKIMNYRTALGVFHYFARSKEVIKYREKSGERREHESKEEHTAAK
jgi:hypothetical protein